MLSLKMGLLLIIYIIAGNPDRNVYQVGEFPRDDSTLAIHIADVVSSDQNSPAPLAVTGTKKLVPTFRTAFKIMPYVKVVINLY